MKNILMTVEGCDTTTIASSIVEKTLELASTFSSKVWILHVAPPSHPVNYSAKQITELYYQRWDVELFFRDIKTTMGTDILRCRSGDLNCFHSLRVSCRPIRDVRESVKNPDNCMADFTVFYSSLKWFFHK